MFNDLPRLRSFKRGKLWPACAAGGLFAALAVCPAAASDWPCIQPKVPEISLVSFWTGASIDGVKDSWSKDRAVADLVDRSGARRTPLAEAESMVADFAKTATADQLLGAVAGLYERLNGERSQVLAGIERYGRKQKAMADAVRKRESRAMAKLRESLS